MRAFQCCPLVLWFIVLLQLSSDTYGYYGDAMQRLGQLNIIPNLLPINSILNTPDLVTTPCEQDYTTEEIVSSFPSSKRSTAAVRIIPTYVPPTRTPLTSKIAETSEQIEIVAEISAALLQLTPDVADIISASDNDINDQILATNGTTKVSKRKR
jgi:hypothetical protein